MYEQEDPISEVTKWANLIRSIAGIALIVCVFFWNMPKSAIATSNEAEHTYFLASGEKAEYPKGEFIIKEMNFTGEGTGVNAYIVIGDGKTYIIRFPNGEDDSGFEAIQELFPKFNMESVRDMALITNYKLNRTQQKSIMDMCGMEIPLGFEWHGKNDPRPPM